MTIKDEIKKVNLPVLIIHGEKDGFVPPAMSKVIEEGNPKIVQRYVFPEAFHGTSFLVDKQRYTQLIKDFTNQYVK